MLRLILPLAALLLACAARASLAASAGGEGCPVVSATPSVTSVRLSWPPVPGRPFYSVTYSPGKFPTRVERTDADVGADGLVAAELTSLNPGCALSIAVCAGATRDACAGPGDAVASCTRTVQTSTRAATASRCDELVNADVAGADLFGVAPDGSRLGTGLSRAACCAKCLDVQAFLPYRDRCVAATFEARRGAAVRAAARGNTERAFA